MSNLGIQINSKNFKKVFKDTALDCLSLEEIVRLMLSGGDNVCTFDGAYFKPDTRTLTLLMDGKFVCGQNNSRITVRAGRDGSVVSSNKTLETKINAQIAKRQSNKDEGRV